MNRRVAEHKGRKGAPRGETETHGEAQRGTSSRAAEAAARVAARYAKAPSYSEMLAEEARAAVRAAEAASRAALDAQAAAESILAGLEAASGGAPAWEREVPGGGVLEQAWELTAEPVHPAPRPDPRPDPRPGAHSASQTLQRQSFEIRWDADMPVREASPAASRASHGTSLFDIPAEGRRETAAAVAVVEDALEGEAIEVVEPAQPIAANLIEFPRELVAARKVRPRRAEGPFAAAVETVGQLSIFEVDPGSISMQPEAAGGVAEAAGTWTGPEWSGIELDEEPREETASQAAWDQRETPAAAAAAVELAPMSLRLMAAVVDGALIGGAFVAAALVAMNKVKDLPGIKEIEVGSAVALAVIGVLYLALFFTLARATPGMKYAGLSLSTFGGEQPTRTQRCGRLGALLLSLLPVGLGVVWVLFDDERLCWHDRLSGTYLRKG
ncbi:MAG: RDD family protein [Terracidiphilus sp.]